MFGGNDTLSDTEIRKLAPRKVCHVSSSPRVEAHPIFTFCVTQRANRWFILLGSGITIRPIMQRFTEHATRFPSSSCYTSSVLKRERAHRRAVTGVVPPSTSLFAFNLTSLPIFILVWFSQVLPSWCFFSLLYVKYFAITVWSTTSTADAALASIFNNSKSLFSFVFKVIFCAVAFLHFCSM